MTANGLMTQWSEGRMDGEGVLTWADEQQYTGNWRVGLMHGTGERVYKDGSVYRGIFLNGKKVASTKLCHPAVDWLLSATKGRRGR